MGKAKKPVEGRKDQKSMLHWVIRTPRQRIEVKGTPGVSRNVIPQVTSLASSSGVHVGVSPSPTAVALSFGGATTVPTPTFVPSTVSPPSTAESASYGDNPGVPRPLSWPASSSRQVANFFIDLVSSDDEEGAVEEPPIEGNETTSTSGPTSALTPSDPTVASSSSQMAIPVITLQSSEDEGDDGSFSDEDEGEQEVEEPPDEDNPTSTSKADTVSPFEKAINHMEQLEKRISLDRETELTEIAKIFQNTNVTARSWEWMLCENGSSKYMFKNGKKFMSPAALKNRRHNMYEKRNLQKIQKKGIEDASSSSEDNFTEEDKKYISEHPCLDVLHFLSQCTEPLSTDREEELDMIDTHLLDASSNLTSSDFLWKWAQKQQKWMYHYTTTMDVHSRFLSLTAYLRARLDGRFAELKENLISKEEYEEYRNNKNSYRNGNKRYYSYIGFGVSTTDSLGLLQHDPQAINYFANNPEIPLIIYAGVYTHILKSEPDIRIGHYHNQNGCLMDYVKNGGRILSGAVIQFTTRKEAALMETFLQFAAKSNEDKGGKFQVLNKKYGAIIPTPEIRRAIEAGEKSQILRFEDIPNRTDDPHELNFLATCKELTHKFRPKGGPTTSSTTSKEDRNFSVYIAVALNKEDVGKDSPAELLRKLIGDTSIKKKYYIGKSLTADMKKGFREGHMYEDSSPLLKAAEDGLSIFALKTFKNLTEKEAYDLESFFIFYMLALSELDPNVDVLNREYGWMIHTELVKRALNYATGLTPFITYNCNEVTSSDLYNLPLTISTIHDITSSFV